MHALTSPAQLDRGGRTRTSAKKFNKCMMSSKTRKKSRTSFGATAPPFIDYLKDILRRYPDGGQILKELIQNADDACATKVFFIHDNRSYGTENLWTEDLAKYQGPALYAYNNSQFTDEDWEGIQSVARSVKCGDPNKVGRFGLGFNSVYHITDVTSIFSAGHLGMMDPQEKIFGEQKGGFRWSLDEEDDREALTTMHDQFQPFRDIVSLVSEQEWSRLVQEDQNFNGTLFRFPLRLEPSEISDNLYSYEKVEELFDSFIADAELSLLFLKNVSSVSLLEIDANGSVTTRLEVKSTTSQDVSLESYEGVTEGCTRIKTIALKSEESRETKWLVTSSTMTEGNVDELDRLAEKLKFLPRVDLAFPSDDDNVDCSKSRLCCFLPLPNNESNKTGLPVYVNAYFGLTDNRRHIKWLEEDQRNDEHAIWNELLIKEVLPKTYLTIIQDAIRLVQDYVLPVNSIYNLFPDVSHVQHKEKWYEVALDVLSQLFSQDIAVLSLAKDDREFITLSEAVLPSNGPTTHETLAAIERVLVSCDINLVTLSDSVARAIKAAYPDFNSLTHVTPAFLRNKLRSFGVEDISDADRLTLLEFVLSDEQYTELHGLQLLPLSDGSFKSFTNREEDTVLIDSKEFPRTLLPFCQNLFLQDGLNFECLKRLRQLAGKNVYMLTNLDADQVVRYTRSYLPEEWKKTENRLVTWKVSSGQHPPLNWLSEFWKFVNCHFKELSGFIGLPLIPVNAVSCGQPVKLAKVQKSPTLIFEKNKEVVIPDIITQLVNKVGGTVVKENHWLRHEDLDSYVLNPCPRHVLQVFVNLPSQKVIKELRSVPKSTLEKLKEYISCLDSLSSSDKELLLQLPLFQTMTGDYTTAQSKQAVLMISGLMIPTDVPMPDSVIKCASEADRRLLQLLKISLLDTAQAASLLIDSVERRACTKTETEKIMAWILDHGNIIFYQNPNIKRRCANLPFIDINGKLNKLSNLYDPRVHTFKVLFEDDYFPPAVYTKTPQMFPSLIDLGLIHKEVDVSPEHMLHAATLLEKLSTHDPQEARKRALVFLKILDANDLLEKFTDEQLEKLKGLKWFPVTKSNDSMISGFFDKLNGLKWFSVENQNDSMINGFFCPEDIRHSMYEDIAGYVMPLEGTLSENICSKLGLKRPPRPEKVVENLSALISKVSKISNPDTNVDFKRKLRSIYGHMHKSVHVYTALISKDTKWLWNHSQFVAPKELVVNYPHNLDLSSHIGKVPHEFLPYRSLFLEFGLREELTDEEIIKLLYTIKQTIESREVAIATSSEVKVSIDILNWICREKKVVPDDVPVPVIVHSGRYTLKTKSETVFCDLSKNGLKELESSQEEMHVVHEEIPITTAEWLDIQLLSTYILDPKSVGIEQCGQTEPITTRIKNILKEYDEESDIFKEIIQNAEDAGAHTCKFLLDSRVHKDDPESLIDPDMKLCQGPCVWAFNNEQFSQNDWDNIVRVGSASKENKVEKIGMFGLGFNTVYHVTDIPSILSGSTLLILDPNTTHLKKRIKHKSNPGIKLDLSRQSLFQWFPAQFVPYEGVFNCSFSGQTSQHFPGTLIKLPFRTKEESLSSEISTKVYYNQDILTFQKQLTQDSQSHLIFLKNISTLSLQTAPKFASTPLKHGDIEDIFTVSKTTLCSMDVSEEGFPSMQHKAEELLMQLNRKSKEVINCRRVDIVKITCQKSGETQVQCWLLYNCFGTKESLKMATGKNKKVSYSLPIGGVALPLQFKHETETFVPSQTNLAGQAFCFLPLSISTGLPFNVNGTFAVTSNRKGLWESGVKHKWNKSLLQDPLVTAFITALLALKEMSQNKKLESYCYYTFWPDREQVSETFRPLVDAFYSTIAQPGSGPKLFSDGEYWFSLENVLFLHDSIEEDQNICPLAMQVCQTYVKSRHVVKLPGWIRNSFIQAGLEKVLQDKTWNWERFYKEAVFTNLDQMVPEWRDALMLHAIHLNMKDIDSLLVSYPCIPATNGQLQYIQNLVNPKGKVACLFEHEEGRFLGGTINDFCSPQNVSRLQGLGMASDELSLEDITEKTETISIVWNNDKNKAYAHMKCLLELLKLHLHSDNSPFWVNLRGTQFLPAFIPGDVTMEREVMLQSPANAFTEKCALLVNMTQPVLNLSELKIHSSDSVLQMLRVNDNPGPEMVIEQLKQAKTHSQSLDKSVLHKIANECYRFLDHCLCNSCSDTTNAILQNVKSFSFVLVGDRFVNVSCVAETAQFEARPYLYALPHNFTRFRTLWAKVGVKKEFTVSQCLEALKNIHPKYKSKPLSKSDLSICLTILNKGIYETGEKLENCLVPNKNGVLQPAQTLFYNDSPWMPVEEGVTFCHENISRMMALHLGIKTTRHHLLKSHAVENMSPFSFQFEQQEKLTVRIKNIIAAYPSKKDILKELIQNADDAEATEIHFVWDKRQHNSTKTFGEKWNDLQGPALCVFNNKVFSDADLKGIQQLGEGGKHNSPGKTGKYGLGFNSVYHLTDCPSIVTGDKLLCISDPNQRYIESTSDVSPAGIGYELNDSIKQTYLDVYNAFLPDKFNLKEGTMFRLPLRTDAMAESSEISHQSVTEHHMTELCSALAKDPEEFILFLKNVSKIQIQEIDASGRLHTNFSIEKNIPKTSVSQKDTFVKLKDNALLSDMPLNPQKVVYEMVITTNERETEWIIAEQFGSLRSRDYKDKESCNKLAHAAVAARVSLKTSQQISKRLTTKNEAYSFNGVAFCSLPLPGHTGLPVHINGNFEVDSSRKNLWKEDDKSQKIRWNTYLKQTVVAPLYADLLDYIHSRLADKQGCQTEMEKILKESYLCFFPAVTKEVPPLWHEMVHEVYRSIKEQCLNVIPVFKSFTEETVDGALKVYSFDWCSITEKEPTKEPHFIKPVNVEIIDILEDVGMRLVPSCMKKVQSSFKSAGIKLKCVSSSTVRTFLRVKPLNDPSQTEKQLPLPISETLIKDEKRCAKLLSFCLKDIEPHKEQDTDATDVINGLPLLLTKDKVLRPFDINSPKIVSLHDPLFIGYENKFVDYSTNWMHVLTLESYGFIKKLTIHSAAEYLKPLIEGFLNGCDLDSNGLYIPSDKMLEWLKDLWKFIISALKTASISSDNIRVTLADARQLYSECCILPVICPRNKQKYLRTMGDMPCVIYHSLAKGLTISLFKLGFMKHDRSFFRVMETELFVHLASEFLNVSDNSSVLDQLCNIDDREFSNLSPVEINELQSFLNLGVSSAEDTQDYQKKFKSLPLFETITSERVTINGAQQVYVIDMNELKRFPDLWVLPDMTAILLINSPENMQLTGTLKIQALSDIDYFVRFILPVARKLTKRQKLDCLKLLLSIQHNPNYLKHKDNIISRLRKVKLICSSLGKLEDVSHFYDHDVELFRVMLPAERFVPNTVLEMLSDKNMTRKKLLKQLLAELGMRVKVSVDDIITFAHQVEKEATGKPWQTETLKEKSAVVFKAALNFVKHSEDNETDLLERIAHIKFIFPVKILSELCNYHTPFTTEKSTVSIRGALIESDKGHQELIWSSMPVIHVPIYLSQKLLQLLCKAGAFEKPPAEKVTQNMKNICRSPCRQKQTMQTRTRVFHKLYAFLQANSFQSHSLNGLPLILVENNIKLVEAAYVSMYFDHDEDFRPYLYKVPPELGLFQNFFMKIGVKKMPTAAHFCYVLSAVHNETSSKPVLQPNQQKTVRRAVQQLFKLLKQTNEIHTLGNVKTLYLPGNNGKLQESCELYYNDTVYNTRLEQALPEKFVLLEKLSKCHLGEDVYKHHKLLKLLPQRFQPQMLSEITQEKVVETQIQFCERNCEFSGFFREHLSSTAFRHGLICLIRAQSGGKTKQQKAKEMCDAIFGRIQIVCCDSLKTELWLEKQQLPNTSSETNLYVKQGPQGCIFYVKHCDALTSKVESKICITLAKEINCLFDDKLSPDNLMVLQQLLHCDTQKEVKELLSENKIRDCVENEKLLFDLPAPGTEIPEEWHDALDMNSLNNFANEEYVGYFSNGKYIYALIVEELAVTSGQLTRRYKIDIGGKWPIEVSCLDLYQFKRETQSTQALCCVEGVLDSIQTTRSFPASIEDAKKESDQCLNEIWTLPKEGTAKVIKRLYLRWHPQKNTDCHLIAKEAFEYVKNRIDKFPNDCFPSSGKSANFRVFFSEWDEEARHHRSSRERFHTGRRSYNFWTFNDHIPQPNKEEAKRWCRQAHCDLKAVSNDVEKGSTEWCLFKVHQSVEKSLIAASYRNNGKQPNCSSISAMASKVSSYSPLLRGLTQLVRDLITLDVDAKKTQYPTYHSFPNIPNGQFRSTNERKALDKASEIVSLVETYVNH